LLTQEGSDRAIALDSVTMMGDPFPLSTAFNFSPDRQTRIMIFAVNLNLEPGEDFSSLTAQAEDSQHGIHPLTVEHVGEVPGCDWLTQVNIKLAPELAGLGDVRVSVSLRGVPSNKILVRIEPPQ
jgi:hypothetical protein